MAKIIKLDDRLSNMIAAGEVVTRPASALKELLENAIDAKSSQIEIHLKGNGLDEIKVIDNGVGMDKEDIHLAFLRHATSKIKNEYDLSHIKSLGFRGEAIPAIASVSKMTIASKTIDSLPYEVTYEGGKLSSEHPSPINIGTAVTVSELFYNVPARLKYIKSPQLELSYMLEVCDEMMLSNPNIAFLVTHDGKTLRQSYGDSNYEHLFSSVYGTEVAQNLISYESKQEDIKITSYLIKPVITRSKKNDIVILVNNRTIKNYLLINSVIEGYHTHLMVSRYPIALIRIELDTSLVDVNVHPQKREIKFSNEYLIANLIRDNIRNAFSSKPLTIPDVLKSEEKYVKVSGFEYLMETVNEPTLPLFEESYEPSKPQTQKLEEMDYIGSYAGTYLLFQNTNGLYLIDQHAAAERIRYEKIYKRLGDLKIDKKQLLTPISYQFKPSEATILGQNLSLIESYGLTFEMFGDYIFLLRTLPSWLEEKDLDYMVYGLIEQLRDYQKIDLSKLRDQLAKDISCKGAIKANKALSLDEVNHLFLGLQDCENPYYCPHGRPVVIKFTQYEIEKLFKRIV
ncbi:DNA mismatch repair protein MutL [Acholeplasma morum]|uniref:DNA mismatch repair endonuclease MutL n=1 Tax=Paracholeplasma morum TaxID=264637 RepID=UPI0019588F14|nr:DNA mismatch repair endonuclease MutL [Paracholeplasma morum]MBM7453784.1 DNA mismatch repair protein MutL [Paracholeplasma morum]